MRSATLCCVSSHMWLRFVAVRKISEPHPGPSLADGGGLRLPQPRGCPLPFPSAQCCYDKWMTRVCSLQALCRGLAGSQLCVSLSVSQCVHHRAELVSSALTLSTPGRPACCPLGLKTVCVCVCVSVCLVGPMAFKNSEYKPL